MENISGSTFNDVFLLLNDLEAGGFKGWSFHSGMLFNEENKWWGDRGVRSGPHEGVDLAYFLDDNDQEHQITAGMLIPPLFKGRIINVIDDLLGKTIIVEHPIPGDGDTTLHAFYAHMVPDSLLIRGAQIDSGEILGRVAPARGSCPSHLHISLAWCSKESRLEEFSWADHVTSPTFGFFDPRQVL